jgi:hypothetical protein
MLVDRQATYTGHPHFQWPYVIDISLLSLTLHTPHFQCSMGLYVADRAKLPLTLTPTSKEAAGRSSQAKATYTHTHNFLCMAHIDQAKLPPHTHPHFLYRGHMLVDRQAKLTLTLTQSHFL